MLEYVRKQMETNKKLKERQDKIDIEKKLKLEKI